MREPRRAAAVVYCLRDAVGGGLAERMESNCNKCDKRNKCAQQAERERKRRVCDASLWSRWRYPAAPVAVAAGASEEAKGS